MGIVKSGIPGLDVLFSSGGFLAGDSVLVEGGSGVGKTTLGVGYIVSGIQDYQESAAICTFAEPVDQLVRNCRHFGWDLGALQKSGKLLIPDLSPQELLDQITAESSELQSRFEKMGVKRVLIDAVNPLSRLFKDPLQQRDSLCAMVRAFRRCGTTLMWTREGDEHTGPLASVEHHLADTVLVLTNELKGGIRRRRMLEVLKSRGQKHRVDKQIFEIAEAGLALLPGLTQVQPVVPKRRMASTGIPRLDEMLGGGMPFGSTFLFNTDGLANSYPFFIALAAAGLAAREGVKITPSAKTSLYDVQRFLMDHSYDISGLAKSGQIRFVDYYQRPTPEELKPYVLEAGALSHQQYKTKAARLAKHYTVAKLRWRRLLDCNAAIDRFGIKDFKAHHTARITSIKANDNLGVLFAVPSEMDEQTAAFLSYTCSGIVETWVEDGYQFIQVTKTPSGRISEPGVVEVTQERPFIKIR